MTANTYGPSASFGVFSGGTFGISAGQPLTTLQPTHAWFGIGHVLQAS
jgi:hypothetical protein